MAGLADFDYRCRNGLGDLTGLRRVVPPASKGGSDLAAFAPPGNGLLARLQPDPNELVEWTGTVTMPRWMRDRLANGEVVWTDFR